jgi:hypothetical protein
MSEDEETCRAEASDVPTLAAIYHTDSWVPCMLPSGHEGAHWSTSGCPGGEVRWIDDEQATETPTRRDTKEHTMSEDGGKPTTSSDLTADHEVKTSDGWDRIEMLNGYCWRLKESGLAIPRDLVVIARKAPKPDPVQERYKYHVASWQLTQELADAIANGEADL